MEEKKTILLFGGRICEELYKRMPFSKQYDVVRIGTMLNYRNFPDGISGKDLIPSGYDLVLMDLQSVIEEAIKETINREQLLQWGEQLGEEFRQCFSTDKVIMLHVFRPPYYVVENRVRTQTDKPYIEMIGDVEQAFRSRCSCRVISLHNCYFSQKPYGKPLSLYGFEDEYYLEVADRIDSCFQGRTDPLAEKVNFAFAIDRFRRYFWTLEKKAFLLFLDETCLLENLVLCSTPEFLDKYQEIILELAELCGTSDDIDSYIAALPQLTYDCKEEFTKILEAFEAVVKQQYQKDLDYLSLFTNGMRIPVLLEELRACAKEDLSQFELVYYKQITFYNYGAYFIWKQTGSKEKFAEAITAIGQAQHTKICEKPVVVDIWGSCFSRVSLNFDDEREFVVSAYHFQVPPFIETTPADYEEERIAGCDTWHDSLVKKQLNARLMAEINSSPTKWLLVDFFSLSSQRVYCYQGIYFTDYHEKAAELLGAEKYSILELPEDELRRRVQVFAETVRKRYGPHIIFIQNKRQESYFTQEKEIKDFENKDNNRKINQYVHQLSKHFVSLTQCYYIDLADYFLADETGFMKLSEVHYENEFYEETLKLIHYIIEQEPGKRWYQSYSPEVDQKRIVRFQEKLKPEQIPHKKEFQVGLLSINMYSKGLNFACPLHTFAFQSFLNSKGIHNIVIDYKPVYFDGFRMENPYLYYSRRCENLYQRKLDALANGREDPEEVVHKQGVMAEKRNLWEVIGPKRLERYHKFQNFIDSHYHKTKTCYNSDMLEFMDPGCDCYICVTDVVWKKDPFWGFDRAFLLGSSVMENKYKIAYAASRDVHFVETQEDEEEFGHYIDDIDRISVREESLKSYVECHTGRKAEQVLDPVFLQDSSFYKKIMHKPEEENYIFLYSVVEDAKDIVMQAINYARTYDLMIIETTDLPLKKGMVQNCGDVRSKFIYGMGIEEWLGYIYYAQCIFTNSFHGTSLSVIFHKEFYVGYRSEDKLMNLLNLLGLQERLVTMEPDWVDDLPASVDYDRVGQILKEKRELSEKYILDSIEMAKQGRDRLKDYSSEKRELRYSVYFNTGECEGTFYSKYETDAENFVIKTKHGFEYQPQNYSVKNDGNSIPKENQFVRKGYRFLGWNIRVKIDTEYFWYLQMGGFVSRKEYQMEKDAMLYLLKEGEPIPFFPFNRISRVVLSAVWKKEPWEYSISYIMDQKRKNITWSYASDRGMVQRNPDGSLSFISEEKIPNNGTAEFEENRFVVPGYQFQGYFFRLLAEKQWYWYKKDGTWSNDPADDRHLFRAQEKIPVISGIDFSSAEAYGVWEKTYKESRFYIYYFTANTKEKITCTYDESDGQLVKNPSGSLEYRCMGQKILNDGTYILKKNHFHRKGYTFSGWKFRIKHKAHWYWYMNDQSLQQYDPKVSQQEFADNKAVILDGAPLPVLPMDEIALVIAEAVWIKKRKF